MEFHGTERFAVIEKLGEGGMGVVYEVYDRERDMRLALKTLRETNAARLYRFKREFRALTDLSHPNIIELYDLISDGDDWFLTMELIDGQDLIGFVRDGRSVGDTPGVGRTGTLLDTTTDTRPSVSRILFGRPGIDEDGDSGVPKPPTRRLDIEDTVGIARLRHALGQIARALHVLHGAGIVHRDLKPSNVRVTAAGRAVLMDFGIAAERSVPDAPDLEGAAIGTPAFMAPEQVQGAPPTAAADWYAFGVMMFQALTGRRPFEGEDDAVMTAKTRRDPLPPSIFTANIPGDLELLCRQLLARDPSRRPDGGDVLARLGVEPDAALAAAPLGSLELFVGRTAERSRLHEVYAEVRAGHARVALVHGASGMGKTGLVERFVHELESHHRDPPLVIAGRCYPRERLPYKAFDGALDALSHYLLELPAARRAAILPADAPLLALLFPVLRRVSGLEQQPAVDGCNPVQLREQALAALRTLIAVLTLEVPMVLRIEDLQWADTDSLELLEGLLAPPTPGRLLVIATVRTEALAGDQPLAAVVTGLVGQRLCRPISVGPLSEPERLELVGKLSAKLAMEPERLTAQLEDAWRDSAGSPMLITELARYTKHAREVAGEPASRLGLEDVVWQRCEGLPGDARDLLALLAVAGEPLPMNVLSAAGELAAAAGERAASALRLGHLARLVSSGAEPWLDTSHDKIREAVLGHLSEERTRELHRRIAAALEAWRDPPPGLAARIAGHKAAAGESVAAARYLALAARSATEQLAFGRAMALYEEALALLPAGAEDAGGDAGADAATEILGCRIRTGLAEGMRIVDRNDEALALLAQAQPIAARHALMEELATIHYLRGNLLFPRGDLDGCRAEHERALVYAGKARAPVAEARAHSGLGDAHYMRGSMISAYQQFDRCVEICRAHGYVGIEVANLSMRGMTRYYQNDLAAALRDSEDAARIASAIGHERAEVVARNGCIGWILCEMGEYDRATEQFERALEMARGLGARRFEPNSLTWLGKLAALAGDRARGLALVEESVAICRSTGFAFVGPMALGALALVTADGEARARAIEEAQSVLDNGTASHNYLYFYRDAIDAALAAGDPDTAARLADALEGYTRGEPLAWSAFFVARARALIAHAGGSGDGDNSDTADELARLLAEGRRVGLHTACGALERALAGA